jgi:hypothetical protein
VGYAHSDEHAFSLRTASEGPYNSQEEGRKMARVNPPLHGRRSHTHTTKGVEEVASRPLVTWSGSSYTGRNRGVALSSPSRVRRRWCH